MQERLAVSRTGFGLLFRIWVSVNIDGENLMQMAITFLAVVGGLIFSLAIALLAEELIFGQVFRLFFAKQAVAVKSGNKR
jgi:hypothetical protein